jgi:hypothetical protein
MPRNVRSQEGDVDHRRLAAQVANLNRKAAKKKILLWLYPIVAMFGNFR